MQAIEEKIHYRINGRGRGWAFTKTDFVVGFGDENIHKALPALTRAGKVRLVCHGVYGYPRYSELLGQVLSPDIDQVAAAVARKYNWRIQPSSDTALNLLGLSTQGPGRWVYLSDGPSREYPIGEDGRQILAFRKSARTFWEKVTILHHEAHRPEGNPQPSRYSRHYYDLARMAMSPGKDVALANRALLADVVAFKQRFYPRGWAPYDLSVPGSLRLVPQCDVMAVLTRLENKINEGAGARCITLANLASGR